MNDIFYLDRLDEWLKGMNETDLQELDYKYLGDTQVRLGHYAHLYEKGLELIRKEPNPKELLLNILDEYMARLEEIPELNSSSYNDNSLDEQTRENLKSLVMFGTQATLIKENSRIQAELRQANQNYRDLLSVVTHEIKNSLTSIYGYNRIISKRVREGRQDQVVEITSQVDRLSKKLFSVVDTLMNMALIEKNRLVAEKHTLNIIADVIEPVIKEMELQLSEKAMAVEVISHEDDVAVEGDMHLLQIVIRNLLMNAIQYGEQKTDIEIHVEKVQGRVLIDVYNQGQGIEKKYLKRIFEKFARFSNKGNRTNVGIGLFTVAHIVEIHNGSIKAESEPGRWMRFVINLPTI